MSNITIELPIYITIAGQRPKVSHTIFTTKDDLLEDGKNELIRIAECDKHGDNDQEIDDAIGEIKKGWNKYSYDNYIFSFDEEEYTIPE